MKSILVLWTTTLFVFTATAARTVSVPPFRVAMATYRPAPAWFPSGLAGATCTVAVKMKNLSGVSQNVTATFADLAQTWNLYVGKPTSMSNWTGSPPLSAGGWYAYSKGLSAVVKSVAIPANEIRALSVVSHCDSKHNAASACAIDPASTASTSELTGSAWTNPTTVDCKQTDAICGASIGFFLSVGIKVTEDVGAILANIASNCVIDNAADGILSETELPSINAGRPF